MGKSMMAGSCRRQLWRLCRRRRRQRSNGLDFAGKVVLLGFGAIDLPCYGLPHPVQCSCVRIRWNTQIPANYPDSGELPRFRRTNRIPVDCRFPARRTVDFGSTVPCEFLYYFNRLVICKHFKTKILIRFWPLFGLMNSGFKSRILTVGLLLLRSIDTFIVFLRS